MAISPTNTSPPSLVASLAHADPSRSAREHAHDDACQRPPGTDTRAMSERRTHHERASHRRTALKTLAGAGALVIAARRGKAATRAGGPSMSRARLRRMHDVMAAH